MTITGPNKRIVTVTHVNEQLHDAEANSSGLAVAILLVHQHVASSPLSARGTGAHGHS
jgi:hypothetical protein